MVWDAPLSSASSAPAARLAARARARRRRRRLEAGLAVVLVGLLLLALGGLVTLYLWLSWQRVYWADQLTQARAAVERLQRENALLRAQVAEAFSLARIEAFAKERLGMVEPEWRPWPPPNP